MKKIILIIVILVGTLISSNVMSQTYNIKISKVNELKKYGNHTPFELIDSYHIDLGSRKVNCTYVIDIDKKTSTFYKKGRLVSKLNFDFIEFKNGIYNIYLSDETLNEDLIITHMILDTNKNEFIFSWYDSLLGYTRTNTHIEQIKKSL